jgi:hypothetical protein
VRAVALVVLLAVTAHAADQVPSDAPKAEKLCLTPEDEALLARHIGRLEAENAELRKGPALPTWALVLLGVGLTGAAFAAGYGVAKATQPK